MSKPLPPIVNVHWVLLDDANQPMVEGGTGGYPYLIIDFEGGEQGWVDSELKLLRQGYNCVFLGPWWEDKTEYVLPADPVTGRHEITLQGFTDSPEVVVLAKEFLAAMEADTFLPQTLLKPTQSLEDENGAVQE